MKNTFFQIKEKRLTIPVTSSKHKKKVKQKAALKDSMFLKQKKS